MEAIIVDTADTQTAVISLMEHALNPSSSLFLTAGAGEQLVARVLHAPTPQGEKNSVLSHSLIVATSGSSGQPNLVVLTGGALKASAQATHRYLGGPGRWITALPLAHIAGIQTVLRSAFAGLTPFVALSKPFDPARFARDVQKARADTPSDIPLYCSLVSAQLEALLSAENPSSLQYLDAILVGGGFVEKSLLRRAASAGLRVVTTYGMTETGGGCVYDGVPLEGTSVAEGEDGRLLISGPTLMAGYLDEVSPLATKDGVTWFETTDVGQVDAEGRVRLSGRSDDIIKSGGVKVNLSDVSRASLKTPGVSGAHTFGFPDPTWGRAVAVVVETALDPNIVGPAVADTVRSELGTQSAPRWVVAVQKMPRTELGKADRDGVQRLAEAEIGQGGAWRR